MTVLDYANTTSERRLQWRLVPATVLIGIAVSFGVAYIGYEPLLKLLARGTRLYVTEIEEPFLLWTEFAAVFGVSGAVVGCVAAVRASGARRLLGRIGGFSLAFGIGAAAGLAYAYWSWNPASLYFPKLASVPILVAPISGCVAVLLGFVLVEIRHITAHRPAA